VGTRQCILKNSRYVSNLQRNALELFDAKTRTAELEADGNEFGPKLKQEQSTILQSLTLFR
jgi:hypothetical protein